MIVCVEGHPNTRRVSPPSWDLISDQVVQKACISVCNEPNLNIAKTKLEALLDPNLYKVGNGGSHIFVCSTTQKEPGDSTWPLRHAMLVDTNDESNWNEFPFLKDFNA